jgi:hypothetical protein
MVSAKPPGGIGHEDDFALIPSTDAIAVAWCLG